MDYVAPPGSGQVDSVAYPGEIFVGGGSGLARTRGAKGASGLGDLTRQEVTQIQRVVDDAGRPLEVIGSAARAERRNAGTSLPLGKGPGTRSDIDYVAPPGSHPYFKDLQHQLPSIDPKTGVVPGAGNPNIGPVIRFEPNAKPRNN